MEIFIHVLKIRTLHTDTYKTKHTHKARLNPESFQVVCSTKSTHYFLSHLIKINLKEKGSKHLILF
jgi:hypothetical protein